MYTQPMGPSLALLSSDESCEHCEHIIGARKTASTLAMTVLALGTRFQRAALAARLRAQVTQTWTSTVKEWQFARRNTIVSESCAMI